MNCQYCGKGFWLASKIVDDPDFCNPAHRWKFRKRLETGVAMIRRSSELHATRIAGFQSWIQGPQVVEHLPNATACARFPRMRPIAAAWMPLSLTADVPLVEPRSAVTDASAEHHGHESRQQRVADLVAGLRADIEKRRQGRRELRPCRGPVLVDQRPLAAASA